MPHWDSVPSMERHMSRRNEAVSRLGIEHPGKKFCIGVQWHPEYDISEGDTRIFNAFIAACR